MVDKLELRRGTFRVNSRLARERIVAGKPVLPIGTTVVRCEHVFDTDQLVYGGYHPSFSIVPLGEFALEYQVRITQLDNGDDAIYFVV